MEVTLVPNTTDLGFEGSGYKIKKKVPQPTEAVVSPKPKIPEVQPEKEQSKSPIAKVLPDEIPKLGKREIISTQQEAEKAQTGLPLEPQKASPQTQEDGIKYYEFSKHLGSGSFGIVSKYKDMRTKRYVAIKKVLCDDNVTWQNREYELLQKLLHPNIVRVKSSFKTQDHAESGGPPKRYLNIVMDYIPDNLHKIIQHFVKQKASVPDTLVMIYSYQLFRCLHFMRVHSVAHRDIKPQNILVDTGSHQLFFCDFGSAKTLKPDQPSEDYICSRFYRAPELLHGSKSYTCSVDTWSVGCVMAELILGIPIFMGENTQDQIAKIIEHIGQPDDAEMKAMGSKIPAAPRKPQQLVLKQRLQTKVNKDGLDLLTRVFVYDPEKRIKPLDALQHPFFDPLRFKQTVINQKPITDLFNFNADESKGYERYVRKLTPEWYNP